MLTTGTWALEINATLPAPPLPVYRTSLISSERQWFLGSVDDKYILFEAKLKARNPKESTPLNNIRWVPRIGLSFVDLHEIREEMYQK